MKEIWNNFWKSEKLIYKPIHILKNLYFTKIKAEYIKKFISHSYVLEVGCGNGKLLNLLPKENTFVGLDISHIALKEAKKEISDKNISLLLGDALHLKFKDNSFDLVLVDGLVEHYTEKIEKLIKETYRVIKKGGYLIIILTNNDFIRKMLFKYIYVWDKEKIKTTKEYKRIFDEIFSKNSKEYKIGVLPRSFGTVMTVVVKK